MPLDYNLFLNLNYMRREGTVIILFTQISHKSAVSIAVNHISEHKELIDWKNFAVRPDCDSNLCRNSSCYCTSTGTLTKVQAIQSPWDPFICILIWIPLCRDAEDVKTNVILRCGSRGGTRHVEYWHHVCNNDNHMTMKRVTGPVLTVKREKCENI